MAQLKIIAKIKTDFPTKFGIPRQSGMIEELKGTIVFEPEYRNSEALRGLEEFSHLWLIWQFSESLREDWLPTVRPPRLGGNVRKGVFATRSPFRPSAIGISVLKIEAMEVLPDKGTVIHVAGIDMKNDTPIYDIKPYIPYTDCYPDAKGGFTDNVEKKSLDVEFPAGWLSMIDKEKRDALLKVLAHDPRPSYQDKAERIYGLSFAGYDVRFTVKDNILSVQEVVKPTE